MKLLTALACTAVLALSATAASAAVICNDEGDCWRVKERRDYDPALKLECMTTTGNGARARSTAGASPALGMDITVAAFGSASIELDAALLSSVAPRLPAAASSFLAIG
jgi:hypothetical protein